MKVTYIGNVLTLLAGSALSHTSASPDVPYPPHVAKLMNLDADPCEDFYEFACGTWTAQTQLTPAEARRSYSFSTVQDRNDEIVKQIMQAGGDDEVSRLFASCTDTASMDRLGTAPLQPDLERIQTIQTVADVFQVAGELRRKGLIFLSESAAYPDMKDATRNVLYLMPGTLSLPDKSYYLDDANWAKYGPPLTSYVKTIFKLAGLEAHADQAADVVSKVEKACAAAWLQRAWFKSAANTYSPTTVGDAIRDYPLLFSSYLTGTGALHTTALSRSSKVINFAKPLLEALKQLVATLTVDELRTYLTYRWISENAPSMTTEFRDAWFQLFKKTLEGVKEPEPTWKTCVATVTANLPNLVGKQYFDKTSSVEAETTAKQMVKLVEAAMADNINNAQWLDADTRAQALLKLSNVSDLIGHSGHVEQFDFVIQADAFRANVNNIASAKYKQMLAKLGKRVDKTQWDMPASAVNAYYSRPMNQMVFPIGIFQNPFFDPSFAPAENFGAIGSVVGHELTHGFDSGGRMYDGDGNQNAWWSAASTAEFERRADCMRTQYSKCDIVGESGSVVATVNGNNTITENIADNGGIKLALEAYHAYIRDLPAPQNIKNDKLFFVSFAQNWCAKYRDEAVKKMVATGVHTPPMWRVRGVVMNSAEFATTFQCAPNKPMNPSNKCAVW
ncbi:TPA: hypothetical protein N0F65_010859 [Lagenidium giganteum]|uniref:Endothelin-converting enzyme 1 n=1 Tax=Lagenidium giganteum TaxID=4803 RepID=A0AAV2Z3M6_9STRA|nr:TPA: hypothetical protein N0F65_010859 [Lagenidium giganteum]